MLAFAPQQKISEALERLQGGRRSWNPQTIIL